MRNRSNTRNDEIHANALPKEQITSARPVNVPYRSLKDVSFQELLDAVAKMASELGIHGSGNEYSLYHAVNREKAKVSPRDPLSAPYLEDN